MMGNKMEQDTEEARKSMLAILSLLFQHLETVFVHIHFLITVAPSLKF